MKHLSHHSLSIPAAQGILQNMSPFAKKDNWNNLSSGSRLESAKLFNAEIDLHYELPVVITRQHLVTGTPFLFYYFSFDI